MRQTLALPLRMLIGAVGGCVVGFVAMTWRDWAVEARLAIAPVARQSPAPARVFASDAAIMVKYIKPDKTADFEATVARLKEALERTDSPERRQQAATWKVFRAVEPATNGDAVYVFLIDPTVKGADYAVSKILAEAFPEEAQSLSGRYTDSYSSGQSIVDLTLVASLGDWEPR
jgi:hypothetical protein